MAENDSSQTEDQQSPEDAVEELVSELRNLADEAADEKAQRRAEIDLSEADSAAMAYANYQGMEQAFQQAWKLVVSKRGGE